MPAPDMLGNFCRKLCFDGGGFVSLFFILGTTVLAYPPK